MVSRMYIYGDKKKKVKGREGEHYRWREKAVRQEFKEVVHGKNS